jgi:hypothetical protein
MKAFTLIEVALVIFITAILTTISLQFTALSPETLYLKNFIYKLGSNINLIKDFSLSRREINSDKICGYGLYFKNNGYIGYAFATSSFLNCEELVKSNPLSYAPNSNSLIYIHTNGDVRRDPIETLQIKDNFQDPLRIKVSLNSPFCDDNLFDNYQELALIYYNPYGDILFLGYNNNWQNLLNNNWQEIYFCFDYKNEKKYFKINRSGQIKIY